MRPNYNFLFPVFMLLFLVQCTQKNGQSQSTQMNTPAATKVSQADLAKYSLATFAAGCFWCEEAVFESIKGVGEVISGYAGGDELNPTYEEVGGGRTGHAEAIEVYYDPAVIDYKTLLRVYFASLDPTQVNGQGPDHGPQYRSVIFHRTPEEKAAAEKSITDLTNSGKYNKPIAVQLAPFTKFWKAEDYHQDYVPQNPNNPYVQHESIPRLRRTQEQVKDLVKADKLIVNR